MSNESINLVGLKRRVRSIIDSSMSWEQKHDELFLQLVPALERAGIEIVIEAGTAQDECLALRRLIERLG